MSKIIRHGDATRAIGYLRVSTSRQELSPHAQASAIQAWAESNGVTLVAMFFDRGIGGALPVEERPALSVALGSLRDLDVGHLVTAKRDRLARDVMVATTIERVAADSGCAVISAAGEGNGHLPADKFMRTVLDAVAELESATIRARTSAALAVKKAREISGPKKPRKAYNLTKPRSAPAVAPYGSQLEFGRLVPHPAEQAILEAVKAHHAAGLSMAGIASALTSAGMLNRSGNPFARERVWALLAA